MATRCDAHAVAGAAAAERAGLMMRTVALTLLETGIVLAFAGLGLVLAERGGPRLRAGLLVAAWLCGLAANICLMG